MVLNIIKKYIKKLLNILLFKLKKICSKEHQKELQNLKENKEIIGLFSYLKNKVNIIFFNSRKQTPAIFKKLKIDFSLFNNTNFKKTKCLFLSRFATYLTDFFTNKEIDLHLIYSKIKTVSALPFK